MMQVIAACVFAAAFLTSGQASMAAPPPTLASINTSIGQRGAEATIAMLAKADQWDMVADKIGNGTTAWIALVS